MPDPIASTSPWRGDLYAFAFAPAADEKLAGLAGLAEDADWSYQHTPSEHPFPILFNYVRYKMVVGLFCSTVLPNEM